LGAPASRRQLTPLLLLSAFPPRPFATRRPHPEVTVRVELFPRRLIRLRFRAEAKHVLIGIFDLHLIRPRIVRRRMPDFRSLVRIFLEESPGVLDADPDPRAGISLVSFAQHDGAAVPRDSRHDAGALPIHLEPEH